MGFLTFRESKFNIKFEAILFINFEKKNYLHIWLNNQKKDLTRLSGSRVYVWQQQLTLEWIFKTANELNLLSSAFWETT